MAESKSFPFPETVSGIASWRDEEMESVEFYFRFLLTWTGGNIQAAARLAKCDRGTVYNCIRRAGILPKDIAEMRSNGASDFGRKVLLSKWQEFSGEKMRNVPGFKAFHAAWREDYLIGLLLETDGNVSRASKIAGIDRKSLYTRLRQAEIDPAKYRSGRDPFGLILSDLGL